MNFFELTESQKLVWINERLFPDTSLHVICCSVIIEEAVDGAALDEAIGACVREASALRTVIDGSHEEPRQAFDPERTVPIERVDFRGHVDAAEAFRRLGQREASRPFRWQSEPLARIVVATMPEGKTGLLLAAHHLVADAFSMFLFLRALGRHYRAFLERGQPAERPAMCYSEIVALEKEYLGSTRYTTDRAFWSERLERLETGTLFGERDLLDASTAGRRLTFEWDETLVQGLLRATADAKTTLYGALLGILGSVMARSLGTERVCIGSPFINRPGARALGTLGMCVNTMPVVLHADRERSLVDYVQQAGAEAARCLRHGYFPFLHARRAVPHFASGQPMFDVGLSYQNADFSRVLDLRVGEVTWFFPGHEMNGLTVHAHDRRRAGRLSFDLDYRTDVFRETQIRSLVGALTATAEELVASSEPHGSARNRAWVASPLTEPVLYTNRSEGQRPGLVIDWIAAAAEAHPERIALTEGATSVTYGELMARARRARARLGALGVRRGDAVLVLARRSIDTVTAILGILFAGAAYVPVAPGTPSQRLEKMRARMGAHVVLGPAETADAPGDEGPVERVAAEDACYVLFTSGSTGEPKGVVVDHGGLRHYLDFAVSTYAGDRALHMPLFTSLGFDLTVTALFVPLVTGGTIHVYPDEMDDEGTTLRAIFDDDACDTVKLTPSHLRLIGALGLRSARLRTMVVGGEQLSSDLVEAVTTQLGPDVTFVNEYGPTEAVVGCVYHRWSRADRGHAVVPIGKPIAETTVRIMTPWHQHQLRGFRGELEVGGPGLARGYLDDPEQTADKFITDDGMRWYRTGDVVVDDGQHLHCLGRRDRQIKHLGFRLELADLEAALEGHPAVTASYALHAADVRQLVIFYTGTPAPEPELLEHMRQQLPAYAVPAHAVHCPSFPLNAHGKVDEKELRARWDRVRQGADQDGGAEIRGELPAQVLAILGEVLSAEPKALLGQTFALAGGDSVNAIHVVSKLRAIGVRTRVSALLSAPSLADFARDVQASNAPDDQAPPDAGVLTEPLPMQAWFLREPFAVPAYYHQSILLESTARLNIDAAREALHSVVATHDALRLNLDADQRLFFNEQHLTHAPSFDEYEVPDEDQMATFVRGESIRIKESFDLTRSPLIRGACFRTASGNDLVLLVAHHLAVDIASWFVIFQDWLTAYRARQAGTAATLARPRTSVRRWAEHLAGAPLDTAAYWERVEADVARAPALPEAAPAEAAETHETIVLRSAEGSFFDPKMNEPYATKPQELVLAAFVAAAAAALELHPLVVNYEGHGRADDGGEHDLARTVGWFTSQFPMVLEAARGGDVGALVAGVKDTLRGVPDGGMGWMRRPRPRLRSAMTFNFVGSALHVAESDFRLSQLDSGPDRSPSNAPSEALEAIVQRDGDACRVGLTFDARCFDAARRQRFVHELGQWADAILAHCRSQTNRSFTRSDFETLNLSENDLDALFE